MHILLIEGNAGYAARLYKILCELRPFACRVKSVETLADGLNALISEVYDAIFVNVALPDSQGIETLKTVRAAVQQIPVIALADPGNIGLAVEAARLGIEGCLPLPSIDADLLAGTLAVAMQRHHQQKALRQSEEKYRTIIETLEDGICEVDLDGRLIFFNDAMTRILGYDRATLSSMTVSNVVVPQAAEKVSRAVRKILQTGRPNRSLQYEIIRGDGVKRYLESSVSLLKDACDRPAGLRMIVRDVTRRKQAEFSLADAKARAEAATRARSEFLASMSHEIRTPMNGIIGMYNLLLDTDLSREQADFVETGRRSADSLLSIINDLLD